MKTLLLGAAVLAFAACGSDSPDDPTNPDDPANPDNPDNPDDPDDPTTPDQAALDYADVASLMGAGARSGELAAMLDMVVISYGGTPQGFSITQGDHYAIAEGTRGGVTFNYYYHCNDDADVVLPTCDGTANHSHITPTITGSVTGASMSMSAIDHDGNLAVRDIKLNKPRVGGNGKVTFSGSVTGAHPASYDLSYTTLFDRVRYEPAGVQPLSGKLDFAITAKRTRSGEVRNFSVTASLVFDGDNTATLTLDASKSFSVDLSTGVVTKL